ncbi:PHO85 cyclin-5 [Coemansia sp. RSA 2599]|nr:PHO85 cyclin-5 [Coemansia sp. RSA 2599]
MSASGSGNGSLATPSSASTNDNESPYTPPGEHGVSQVSYVPGDKQQILRSGMVAPFVAVDAKQRLQQLPAQQRPLAGSAASLPVSYRSFVAPVPSKATCNGGAVSAVSGPISSDSGNANIGKVSDSVDRAASAKTQQQQLQSPEEKPSGDGPAAAVVKKAKPDPTKCGRRMFVAALISASKFIYDQTYSNRAWNKITRLPMAQISDMERAFLEMIDYRLYVDRTTYDKFHRLLARSGMRNGRLMVCDPAASSSPSAVAMTPVSPPSSVVMPSAHHQQQQDVAVVPTSASGSASWHTAANGGAGDHRPPSSSSSSVVAPAIPFTPGPQHSSAQPTVDLRTAMNMPLSISATPQIPRMAPAAVTTASAQQQMQEQVFNILRVQQQQQQQQQHVQQ